MSSGEAMAVKARAMFGNRLQEADYSKLLQAKSVPDVAYILHHDTSFRATLEGINDKAIHRGQLEALCRMDLFRRLERLIRFASPKDRQFVRSGVMETEVQLILLCIRSITEGGGQERSDLISRMPVYVEKYLSFSLHDLSEVTDFDELLAVLKNTMYEKAVRRYRSEAFEEIDFIRLEHALQEACYDELLVMVGKYGQGQAAAEMKKIIMTRVELDNLQIIYRLKKYFRSDPEMIRPLMIPHYAMFTEKELEKLIDEEDADGVIKEIERKYHRYLKNSRFTDIETFILRIRFNLNYHFMEYYQEPALVLLSYAHLSEMEISNVVNIIEAVRYHVSADRIRPLLVY
jgi:V/A-type H+-transporting ATPase subunit C